MTPGGLPLRFLQGWGRRGVNPRLLLFLITLSELKTVTADPPQAYPHQHSSPYHPN